MAEKPRYYTGTPGLKGAIKDLVVEFAKKTSPNPLRGRATAINDAVDYGMGNDPTHRQSTDRNNGY